MTPKEMKELAELLQKVPGIKSIELEDVQGLAQLLRETPEIGSIEVKGFFGTKVVITRTGSGTPSFMAGPVSYHSSAPASAAGLAAAASDGEPRESAAGARGSRTSSRRWSARSTSRPSRAPTRTSRPECA